LPFTTFRGSLLGVAGFVSKGFVGSGFGVSTGLLTGEEIRGTVCCELDETRSGLF
tara:strand:- start:56132 stop:56296 length:165 start_codon:yes stop_codon:yes gene_type:complete